MIPTEATAWTIPLTELDCAACAARIEREIVRLPGIRAVTASTLDGTVTVTTASPADLNAVIAALHGLEFDPSIVRVRLPTAGALLNGNLIESAVKAIPGVGSAHADPIGGTILVDYLPTVTSAGTIRDCILTLGYPTHHSLHERLSEGRHRSLHRWLVPSLTAFLAVIAVILALPRLTSGMHFRLAGVPIDGVGQTVAGLAPAIGSLGQNGLALALTSIAVLSLLLSAFPFFGRALGPVRRGVLDENALSALAILLLLAAMLEVFFLERSNTAITAVEITVALAFVQLRTLRLARVQHAAAGVRKGLPHAPHLAPHPPATLTENALRHRPASELAVARANRYLPLIVLLLALTSGAADWFLFQSPSSLLFTIAAVLLAAPPSMMILAAAAPYAASLRDAAACGYFFLGGNALGKVSRLRKLAVGRRGVFIENVPAVSDFLLLDGSRHSEILKEAGALSAASRHPVSQAIARRAALASPFPPANEITEAWGKGISGVIEGKPASIGQPAWLRERGIDLSAIEDELHQFASRGKNVVLVEQSRRIKGAVAFAESILPATDAATAQLRKLGIHVTLVSEGDVMAVKYLAEQVGADILDAAEGVVIKDRSTASVSYQGTPLIRSEVSILIDDRTPLALQSADLIVTQAGLLHVASAITLASVSARCARRNLWVAGLLLGIAVVMASGALAPITGAWTFLAASSLVSFIAAMMVTPRPRWKPA